MILIVAGDFPVFVVEPTDTVATPIGNHLTATLHCESASYRTDSGIQWYKDGTTIEMALLPSYFNSTNTSLVVATVHSDNEAVKLEGMYYCVISNTLGSVRSRSALVRSQYHFCILEFHLQLVADGCVGRRVVSFIYLTKNSVFYHEETVVVAQVGYMQLPLSDNRTTLWTVECAGGKFTCSSVSCPLWHHVSGVGRLLIYSILRLTCSEIKSINPKCLPNSNIIVTSNLKNGMSAETFRFTFGGQYLKFIDSYMQHMQQAPAWTLMNVLLSRHSVCTTRNYTSHTEHFC